MNCAHSASAFRWTISEPGIQVLGYLRKLPVRQDQNRPLVHTRSCRQPGFDCDRSRRDRPWQHSRNRDHRRRRRNRRAVRAVAPGRLHAGAGLPVQPSATRRRGGRHADTAAPAPDGLKAPFKSAQAFKIAHASRSAKCAPQNATTAPRHSAARPARTPEIVGIGLGAEAA